MLNMKAWRIKVFIAVLLTTWVGLSDSPSKCVRLKLSSGNPSQSSSSWELQGGLSLSGFPFWIERGKEEQENKTEAMVTLVLYWFTCKRLDLHQGPPVGPDTTNTNKVYGWERKRQKKKVLSSMRQTPKTQGWWCVQDVRKEEGKNRDERPHRREGG